MRSLQLFAIVALLLAVPMGAAQLPVAPPGAVYTVEIQGAPAAFTGLDAPNATSTAAFQVVLTLANVVCQGETIPVTVTATAAGAPAYFSTTVMNGVINFTIAPGPHLEAAEPAGGTGDASVVGAIAGNITSNASVEVVLTATAPAPATCQPSVPAATSAPISIFANMTAPPPPPPEPTPEEDTPFVGVLAVAAVAVAVALARRRRA